MSVFRWRGNGPGTKSDFNDGRNWVNDAGVAYAQARYPGSVAGTEDDVYFDAAVTGSSSMPCTTKCDQSDATDYPAGAEVLRSLHMSPAYNGDLGALTKYFKAKVREGFAEGSATANATFYIAGWDPGVGEFRDGITRMVVREGVDIKLDGKIGELVLLKGFVTCASGMTIAEVLTVGYMSNPATDVMLVLNSGMSLPDTISIAGGVITNYNPIANLAIGAGTWTQQAGDMTSVHQIGGTLAWNGGNITTLHLYSGQATAAGSVLARRIADAEVYPGASLTLDNGQRNILVTGRIRNYGGTVVWPSGGDIAPYPTLIYAGASDAKQGISPQSLNNSTANGDAIYIAEMDRLDVYCCTGALAGTAAIVFKLQQSATSGGTFADIAGKSVSLDDGDDDQVRLLSVWGYELGTGGHWVRVTCTNSAAVDALVSAACIKSAL